MKIFISIKESLKSTYDEFDFGFYATLTTETLNYSNNGVVLNNGDDDYSVSYCSVKIEGVNGALESGQYTTYTEAESVMEYGLSKIGLSWNNNDGTFRSVLPYKMSPSQAFYYIAGVLEKHGWVVDKIENFQNNKFYLD